MATLAAGSGPASYRANQSFFVKMAWLLVAIIVIGFTQNAALGRVDIPAVPVWVHLHGLLMLTWLGLFVTQNRLAASGNLALHRKLGWIAAFVVCAIFGLACFTGVMSLKLHRFPFFFTAPFFLSLVFVEAFGFAGLVFAGIASRADTESHRRLMMGSTILILEPAFGRLLPMPLIGGETSEWIVLAIQLAFVGAIALQDRRTIGMVHRATFAIGMVIALEHVLVSLAARSGPVIALAAQLTGQG
jgi:hypothetical protein